MYRAVKGGVSYIVEGSEVAYYRGLGFDVYEEKEAEPEKPAKKTKKKPVCVEESEGKGV